MSLSLQLWKLKFFYLKKIKDSNSNGDSFIPKLLGAEKQH